ncbi:MAG: nitrate reductase [Chloroflexota bacterium]|nr:MAG: nitrate reductase [Chloroflexota bacterium]
MPIAANEWSLTADTPFEAEMPQLWGDWGCSSEIGRLRAVLLHRPGPEIEQIEDPAAVLFAERMNPERARRQHDAMADVYRAHGVDVHYIEHMPLNKPNGMFVRDLVAMTPEGAIVARPGTIIRRGEERYAAEALARLGVPILRTIAGTGTFEGADLLWANRDLAFVSLSRRTNAEGARQVKAELERMGVGEIVTVQVPWSEAHLDGMMAVLDRKLAIVYTVQVPYVVVEAFRRHGFHILEVTSEAEVRYGVALNFVALEPGKIVIPHGNNAGTVRMMQEAGVEVIQVEIDELMKGAGAIHCMTAFLKRDEL